MPDLTFILSGPLAQRGAALAALEQAKVDLSEGQPTNPGWHQFPDTDPTVGWVRCRHDDVEKVVEAVGHTEFRLRAHRHTPACKQCGGMGFRSGPNAAMASCLLCDGKGFTNRQPKPAEQVLREQLDDMAARLAALEAKQ